MAILKVQAWKLLCKIGTWILIKRQGTTILRHLPFPSPASKCAHGHHNNMPVGRHMEAKKVSSSVSMRHPSLLTDGFVQRPHTFWKPHRAQENDP